MILMFPASCSSYLVEYCRGHSVAEILNTHESIRCWDDLIAQQHFDRPG